MEALAERDNPTVVGVEAVILAVKVAAVVMAK